MTPKVIHWLLITLVYSLGLGQLLRYQLGPATFYLHDLLIVAILALLTLQGPTLKALCKPPLWAKLIGAGLLVGWLHALTLYPPQSLVTPALYTLRLTAYLTLYLALKSSKQRLHRADFLAAAAITLVIGLAQYILLPDMRIFRHLGWDDHLDRLTLPHFDPTFTAVMLALPLTILLSAKLTTTSFFFLLLSGLAILLTYSRSVWLALALTLLITWGKKTVLPLLALFIAAALFLPTGPGEGTNLQRTYSLTSRINHDLQIARRLGPSLLLGVGYNTLTSSELSADGYPQHAHGPNNSYLAILSTIGIVGLAGLLLLLRSLAASPYRPIVIFLALASLFNNVLLYPFALLWLILLVATVPRLD